MGKDKASITWGGSTIAEELLKHLRPLFDEMIYSVSRGSFEPANLYLARVVEDSHPVRSAINGIATAARSAESDELFLLACDYPAVRLSFIERLYTFLGGNEGAVPAFSTDDGREQQHWLLSWYRKAPLMEAAEEIVRTDDPRVALLGEKMKLRYVAEEDLREADQGLLSIRNINTQAEYEALLEEVIGKRDAPFV